MLDMNLWVKNITRMDPITAFNRSQKDTKKSEVARINQMLQRIMPVVYEKLSNKEEFKSLVKNCESQLRGTSLRHLRGRQEFERLDIALISMYVILKGIEMDEEKKLRNLLYDARKIMPFLIHLDYGNTRELEKLYRTVLSNYNR